MDREYALLQILGWSISFLAGLIDYTSVLQTVINAFAWSIVAILVKAFHEQIKKNSKTTKNQNQSK